MTVKKLTLKQKQAIVLIYDSKTRSIKQLADFLCVSTRTIGRVLEEAGLALPVERIQAEAKTIMAMLYKHKITVQQLESLLDAVMIKSAVREMLLTQVYRTKKYPTSHNGKQTMLPLNFPSLDLAEFV